MIYEVLPPASQIQGNVSLSRSKSISNRALIIRALCSSTFQLHHLSHAEDTRNLQRSLTTSSRLINAGAGAAPYRFLLAYFAIQERECILTGTSRLKQRPIGILVESLRQLGARIKYLNQAGYPPVRLQGGQLKSKTLTIDASVSSQFISALLLIAPQLNGGLTLQLKNKQVSAPYIDMTLKLMEHFGIATDYKKDTIYIAPQSYKARDYTVAPDWTNASYFYLLPALSPNASITLQDLQRDTIQGDAIIQSIMEDFGVSSEAKSAGLTLHNSSQYCSQLQYDFTSYPDLVPTVLAACASTGIPATIRGVQHLAIKESNRLMVLKEAFRQLGVALLQKGKEWQCKGQVQSSSKMPVIDTYNDHRIAMALAPLAIPLGGIRIKDPLVVDKSFPQYWQQLKQVGFQLKPIEGAPDL